MKQTHKLTAEQKSSLIADYLGGMTTTAVAARYGIRGCSAWELLNSRGLTRSNRVSKQRYDLDPSVFDVVTPESAYWAGFLLTDGCVSDRKNGEQLIVQIQDEDREHLEKLRSFLKSSHPIATTKPRRTLSGEWRHHARLCVPAKPQMLVALARLGVVPRKTKIADASALADNAAFWRGCIDGDGSVLLVHPNSGPTESPQVSLCSGSELFIQQFRDFVRKVAPNCGSGINFSRNTWDIKVGGHSAIKLLKATYANAATSLDRKQKRADYILEIARLNPRWCCGKRGTWGGMRVTDKIVPSLANAFA